jgi:signal transduction histidine kinase
MIAIDARWVIFCVLLLVLMGSLLSVYIDRYRFRDPLWQRAGIQPGQVSRYFDAAPIGLLLLDRQLRPLYANTYSQNLLPITCQQPLPSHDAWVATLAQDVQTAKATDARTHYRLLTLPDGQSLSWWICALPELSLLLLTDMTNQYQSQKNAQTFLSNLSHELRTPLTAILAHLDVAQNEQLDEAVKQNSLQMAQQEMRRLSRLVQNMLQLGRLEMREESEKRPLNLLILVESAITQVYPTAEVRNIAITLNAATPLPQVLGDGDQLQQLLLNLLDNSIKYCRPGDQIELRLQPEGKGVRVTLVDTGPGIPPEHLPRISERFYRVNRQVPGSGLGLAIAAEILRHHQSTLEISSQSEGEETYTAVSFLLPLAPT